MGIQEFVNKKLVRVASINANGTNVPDTDFATP
jgi:hypothetical protein